MKLRLNKEQLAAVRYKNGPLLIIAGAGTGKTTVITERIKYLIEKGLAKPSEILALTFTEKASREMEERVDIAMPYGYTQMWISTFHSFCDRVLRAEALHIGLDPRYKLMTGALTTQLIRNNLFKFKLKYFRPMGNPTKFVGGMLQHFGRLQDENVSPSDYVRWAKTQKSKFKSQKDKPKLKNEKAEIEKWMELAEAYKTYEELKVKEGVMDFGDLIVKTLLLFKKRPNILANYQKQFKHVLVDEFQDTNFAQNELAMLLAKKHKNITVTGDDDQSIYRFRGAAVSNILQFRKTYKKAKVVTLTKNYRSSQEILDKAYDLVQHNNPDRLEVVEGVDKKLVAQVSPTSRKASKGDTIKFLHLDRVENEAEEVVIEINKLVVSDEKLVVGREYEYKDVAILVRANNHAEPFIRALARHNIPYQFLGPGRLFKQPEIIDMISYLKVLYNFEDSVSLYRLFSIDYFEISAFDLVKLSNYARRKNMSLFEAGEVIDDLSVSDKTKIKVNKLIKLFKKHFKLIKRETAGQLLYYFLEDTGLIQKLLNPDSMDSEKRAKNISKFFDKLKTYEVDHEDATIPAVVDWLELAAELGESPLATDSDWTQVNAVNILTVHSAKGLEFPIVFLVNLVSQRFPTNQRSEQIPIPEALIKEILPEGDFHQQEERRLFYVGMTRAMERLYFTAANYYGEAKREKRLSPFIFESLGDTVVASEQATNDSLQLSFLNFKPRDLSPKTYDLQPIHIDFLSYSQIQTFDVCPLHYKLRYILKIPTPPSAALSFGSTIHNIMQDFYKEIIQMNPASRKAAGNYHKLMKRLLETNWINEGYASKSHEKKMYERGRSYLSGFLKKGFNPKILPKALEQKFVVPLTTKRGDKRLKVGGMIDRIDPLVYLGQAGIEIIDYKTGTNVPTQKQVDNDLQLTMYALAATSIKEPPFGVKPKNIKLSLYFFEEQVKISTTRTAKQLKEAEKEIFTWREKIEKSDFQCSKGYLCQNCEYKLMCEVD